MSEGDTLSWSAPRSGPHVFRVGPFQNTIGIEISRLTDVRQVMQASVCLLFDPETDFNELGRKLCDAFDEELAARPRKPEAPKP